MKYGFVCCLLIFLDGLLKSYIHREIPLLDLNPCYPYGGIPIFHHLLGGIDCVITHAHNTGAAWGILSDYTSALVYIRVGLVLYLLFTAARRPLKQRLSLLLIVTGAVGNLVDLWLYGYVIDMFYFIFFGHSFAIFNLADSFISIGVVLYLLFAREKPVSKVAL